VGFFVIACNVIHTGEIALEMFEKTVYLLINCRLGQFSAHECFSRWLGPNPGNPFLLVLLECKQKMPEISGAHFALSYVGVGIFIMKTYCSSWLR